MSYNGRLSEEEVLARSREERRQIVERYDLGREDGAAIDDWEDPKLELYHSQDRFGFIQDQRQPKASGRTEKEQKQLDKEMTRVDKWLRMLKESSKWFPTGSRNHDKLVERVWKGVPERLRGTVWRLLLDLDRIKAEQEGKYEEMKKLARLHSPDIRQIDLDVNRTYRNHIMFRERYNSRQQDLFHVLAAYSMYNSEIGYCQGMSQIAALLLMYLNSDEDAFWALSQLMVGNKFSMHGFFIPHFPKLLRFQDHHDKILMKKLRRLQKHLIANNVDTGIYTLKWYFQCFLDRIPFSLTIRVWDIYLLEGESIMFAMAYTLLKLHRKSLLKMGMDELLEFLQRTMETDFAFEDDYVVENALKECLSDLRSSRLHTAGPVPEKEKPQKPFGLMDLPGLPLEVGTRQPTTRQEKEFTSETRERKEENARVLQHIDSQTSIDEGSFDQSLNETVSLEDAQSCLPETGSNCPSSPNFSSPVSTIPSSREQWERSSPVSTLPPSREQDELDNSLLLMMRQASIDGAPRQGKMNKDVSHNSHSTDLSTHSQPVDLSTSRDLSSDSHNLDMSSTSHQGDLSRSSHKSKSSRSSQQKDLSRLSQRTVSSQSSRKTDTSSNTQDDSSSQIRPTILGDHETGRESSRSQRVSSDHESRRGGTNSQQNSWDRKVRTESESSKRVSSDHETRQDVHTTERVPWDHEAKQEDKPPQRSLWDHEAKREDKPPQRSSWDHEAKREDKPPQRSSWDHKPPQRSSWDHATRREGSSSARRPASADPRGPVLETRPRVSGHITRSRGSIQSSPRQVRQTHFADVGGLRGTYFFGEHNGRDEEVVRIRVPYGEQGEDGHQITSPRFNGHKVTIQVNNSDMEASRGTSERRHSSNKDKKVNNSSEVHTSTHTMYVYEPQATHSTPDPRPYLGTREPRAPLASHEQGYEHRAPLATQDLDTLEDEEVDVGDKQNRQTRDDTGTKQYRQTQGDTGAKQYRQTQGDAVTKQYRQIQEDARAKHHSHRQISNESNSSMEVEGRASRTIRNDSSSFVEKKQSSLRKETFF